MKGKNERLGSPIRIFLTDDHDGMRTAIRSYLSKLPNIAIVGEASTVADLLGQLSEIPVELLLLDFHLKDTTADQVLPCILKAKPRLRVLIVSAANDTQLVRGLISLGASGYLLKDDLVPHVADAIRGILDGDRPWFSPSIPLKGRKALLRHSQELRQRSETILRQTAIRITKSQVLLERSFYLRSLGDGRKRNTGAEWYSYPTPFD